MPESNHTPAPIGADALRKELIADLREVFDASGQETPQIVRDVIEYADSWLSVCIQRAAESAAPTAQAAPTYEDSTPELHVGDSAFESWYSTYNPSHKSDKQRARDAYAAGMGDPLVMAAGTLPTYTDDLELRYAEVCEERDHLREVLKQSGQNAPLYAGDEQRHVICLCPDCTNADATCAMRAQAAPAVAAADVLEQIANEPPINGNNLAAVRIMMAAQMLRDQITEAAAAPQPAVQQGWDIDAAVEKAWGRFQAAMDKDEPLPPPSIHATAHYGTWLGREAHWHDEPKAGAFRNAARMLAVLEAEIRRLHAELIAAQPAAPVAQGDAPTDSGPISRQWLTVVYRGVEAGDEVQQICTHPKVSAMSWSHALHDRDVARSQAKEGA